MERVVPLALCMMSGPQAGVRQEGEIKKALATCAALSNETARVNCVERLARAVTRVPFKSGEPPVSKSSASAPAVPAITASEAASHIGEEVVVEGAISGIGYSARSDTPFLNMGGRQPNHAFSAVIFRSARPLCPEAGSWEGVLSVLGGVLAALLLCWAFGRHADVYYVPLRWVVCGVAIPVIPVHLKRVTWQAKDTLAGVVLLVSIGGVREWPGAKAGSWSE
jgi:hypothetical protein